MRSVAVIGASGFVGRACASTLASEGWSVLPLPAPRLVTSARSVSEIQDELCRHEQEVSDLVVALGSCETVVNAAGMATPGHPGSDELFGANALLPAAVVRAAVRADAQRVLHISSAAVQGRRTVLDESAAHECFSPYSRSKALGEDAVLHGGMDIHRVVHRPTSVHGRARRVTRTLARVAASPLSSVAAGEAPTPQVHVIDVARAVAFMLAEPPEMVPSVVLQPNGGMTTGRFFELLGDRAPRRVPDVVARALVKTCARAATVLGHGSATSRRLEMMWFGQDQVDGWLGAAGFEPTYAAADWQALGREARGV